MPTRTPDEIRASIVQRRGDLVGSVEQLRNRVQVLTDWRRQVNEHRGAAIAAGVAVGFLVGRRIFRRRG